MRAPFLLLLVISFLYPGCEKSPSVSPAKPPVVILVAADLTTFDPQVFFDMDSSYVLGNIYESLVEFDENFQPTPGLAKRWTNPDDHTWRFYLNEEAYFSDGAQLSSADVKFSIERLKTVENSELLGFAEHIREIELVNDHTIDIKTNSPFRVLNNLVFIPILSKKHTRAVGKRINVQPLGTGPYKLQSHERGKTILLTANEYYRPETQVQNVEFQIFSGNLDRVLETVIAMKPDVTLALPFRKIQEFRQRNPPDLELRRSNGITVEYLIYNLKPEVPGFDENPLQDLNLRRALAHAVDRPQIVQQVLNGFARPATQMVAPEVFGYDSSIHPPDSNLEKAKDLIRSGGYTNLQLPIHSLKGGSYRLENLLIERWKQIGLRPTLRIWNDVEEMNDALDAGEFLLALSGYICTSGDAGELLTFGLHTRTESGSYGKGNYANYSNAEVDRLSQENLRVLDARKRLQMLNRVMAVVNAELPYLPILIYDDVYIVSKRIQWNPHPSGEIKIRNIQYR